MCTLMKIYQLYQMKQFFYLLIASRQLSLFVVLYVQSLRTTSDTFICVRCQCVEVPRESSSVTPKF